MYRRILAFALVLVLLSGCSLQEHFASAPSTSSTEPPSTTDTSTTVETELPETSHATTPPETSLATEETAAPIETTVETEPAHSELFIPFVTPEEMVTYFNEVCLDAEFVNSGNASVLQRWENPIYYQIYGDPTDLDLQILNNMCQWLNTIDGFPGIYETAETWQENYSIYFCTQDELINRMGDEYYGVDGAFTFWYNDNIIYDCTVCIRTDLDQEVRNSVILEELYNSLGPAQDTNLRQESIIYAGYSIPQALHPIDEVILKLLYHPDLLIGMDARDCEPIIHSLYY
jgi:hypothetical protein